MSGRSGSPAEPMHGAEAVVLVGGRGTRLRPLTLSAPKPMLPTAGLPFLTHLLSRIRAAGITHVVLGTSYQAEVFAEYFGDGSGMGLDLEYVVEQEPLDTAGALRNVGDRLSEPDVVVFNGDILSGVDLPGLMHTHRANAADVTLHLVKVDDPRRFGCVPTDDEGRVTAFLEKTDDPPVDQVNAGCYVFRRSVIESIPADRPVSVERETFPGLLASGARLQGHVDASYWLDLGTPAAFVRGSADLVRGVVPSDALPEEPAEALMLDGARVAEGASVTAGSTIGQDCVVESGARIEASTLFDRAHVAANAVVERSVVGVDAHIGEGAVVRGAVIADGAHVGSECELLDGARVWPGVRLPAGGVRFSHDC
ncbi:mannose-1-phosphate guanylyltransferase [Saccharopolyspora lacisalsi]|uniref:Mannose-1-phosphate guanylyltransferase n=1 Tax=Halosaccharopolyspora lacisalsi TaxID=1000566 RepID=A0A839E6K6_9PSEU|nr:NDP-sugar synthase [Halosaccharopolyspora lacisalsi]MBA8826941.1 mannose-1-phosphate guanylyltransferase [Halosaccharopolyspora lacisalsi]